MNKHFEIINGKLVEFMQFAQMMNMRAIRDIGLEMVSIMRTALADGYTLEQFKIDTEEAMGSPIPDDEPMLEYIEGWFDAAEKLEAKQ